MGFLIIDLNWQISKNFTQKQLGIHGSHQIFELILYEFFQIYCWENFLKKYIWKTANFIKFSCICTVFGYILSLVSLFYLLYYLLYFIFYLYYLLYFIFYLLYSCQSLSYYFDYYRLKPMKSSENKKEK